MSHVCVSDHAQEYFVGQHIITQGEVGEAYYVLRRGTAKVFVDQNEVASCTWGMGFGEVRTGTAFLLCLHCLSTTVPSPCWSSSATVPSYCGPPMRQCPHLVVLLKGRSGAGHDEDGLDRGRHSLRGVLPLARRL